MEQDRKDVPFQSADSQENVLKRPHDMLDPVCSQDSKRFCADTTQPDISASFYGNAERALSGWAQSTAPINLPYPVGMFDAVLGSRSVYSTSSFSNLNGGSVRYNSSTVFQSGITQDGEMYGSYHGSFSAKTMFPPDGTSNQITGPILGNDYNHNLPSRLDASPPATNDPIQRPAAPSSNHALLHSTETAYKESKYHTGLSQQVESQQGHDASLDFDSVLPEAASIPKFKREHSPYVVEHDQMRTFEDRMVPGIPDKSPNQTSCEAVDVQSPDKSPHQTSCEAVDVQSPDNLIIPKSDSQIDTCFGVILLEATSSFDGGLNGDYAPVKVQPLGDVLKLNFQDSDGWLCGGPRPKDPSSKTKKTLSVKPNQIRQTRIVVRGLYDDLNRVGEYLSDAELFLQQPSIEECGQNIIYHNPHFLVRPGAQMPELDELSISDSRKGDRSEFADEIDRNRFRKLFDEATVDIAYSSTQISPRIRTQLKEHQMSGVAMMIEKEVGNVESLEYPSVWVPISESGSVTEYRHVTTGALELEPPPVRGGILADDMGLGKSLTLLALICSSLDDTNFGSRPAKKSCVRATLLIAPKSTIPGWLEQIKRHVGYEELTSCVYHGSSRKSLAATFEEYDIVLTTYETMRSDHLSKGPIYNKIWRRVVLDEAHRIRNRSTGVFKSACSIQAIYRWCLTGTPIQNSLDDYGALLSFIKVPCLIDKQRYDFWITNPVNRGTPNSFERLRSLVRATCLRRTKLAVQEALMLPDRSDRVHEVGMDSTVYQVYVFFRDMAAKIADKSSFKESTTKTLEGQRSPGQSILRLILFLRLICDHGFALLPQSAIDAWHTREISDTGESLFEGFIDICVRCRKQVERAEDFLGVGDSTLDCGHLYCAKCISDHFSEEDRRCPACMSSAQDSRGDMLPLEDDIPSQEHLPSAKVKSLLQNLTAEQACNNQPGSRLFSKSVVFSCWTKMLDLVQKALLQRGFSCVRLDGRMSIDQRELALARFNEDQQCTVMLASISSAGEGINLTIANYVHLLEPHYNPMLEAQAIDRVHRLGQERQVHVTRYIVKNSIEVYIQWVQKTKLKLIQSSLENADLTQTEIVSQRLQRLREILR